MIAKSIGVLSIVTFLFGGCSSNDINEFVNDSQNLINNDTDKITSQVDANFTSAEIQSLLDIHNAARAEVGVYNELVWSDTIAADAQSYADTIAASGVWGHDPNNSEGYANGPYGENLYTAYPNQPTLATASQAWVDEKAYYHYGVIGDTSTCDTGQECGHYTQVIWANTSEVGCGMSQYETGNYKDWYVIVCKYKTPGNYIGETPY